MIRSETPRSLCPFHDGPETLDLLLAEIEPDNRRLTDAVLDLRSLLQEAGAEFAAIRQLFVVRSLLDDRHHLAFYRVRCWLRRTVAVEFRRGLDEAWSSMALPLGAARVEEIVNACGAELARDGEFPAGLAVRFSRCEAESLVAE